MIKSLRMMLVSFIAALVLLSPFTSHASGDDSISVEEMEQQARQSGSAHLLAKMYGSWVLDLYGSDRKSSRDAVVTPITIFAALVGIAGWTLFMVLVGYVGVVGLFRTAQNGQFMGGEWNSTWVLGRILGALILSAPLGMGVNAGGSQLATGQILVVRAALLSSAAADIVWGKTLNAIGQERIKHDPSMQAQAAISPSQARDLIKKGYSHGVCFGSKVRAEVAPGAQLTTEMTTSFAKACNMQPGTLNLYLVGMDGSNSSRLKDDDVARGSFYWEFAPEKSYRYNVVRQKAHEISVNYYLQALRLGRQDGQDGGEQIEQRTSTIDSLGKEYYTALSSTVTAAIQAGFKNSVDQFSAEVTRNGWVSAGNYYRALAAQQVSINGALNEALSVGGAPPNPGDLPLNFSGDDYVYTNVDRAVTLTDVQQDSGFVSSMTNKALSAVLPTAKDLVDRLGINMLQAGDSVDPLIVASNVGHGMAAIGQFGFLPMLDYLRPLFYMGAILGDIIPSLPWVFFMFSVLSWLIHVTEMFISAPLWIAAHASPEGRDHTSNLAAKGYDNMLFIMLYPLLAIGGFIVAMGVSWIGMYMLNHLIAEQFAVQLGGGFGALTHVAGTLMAFGLLYLGCAWLIVTMSFNLIQAFPRTILNWLSTSHPGHDAFQVNADSVTGASSAVYGYVSKGAPVIGNTLSGSLPNKLTSLLTKPIGAGGSSSKAALTAGIASARESESDRRS